MNKLSIVLAIGVLLLSVGLTAVPAQAGLAFEDPQLCVNGKLLMVEAPVGSAYRVRVGTDLTVSFNIASCGGDPTLPVFKRSQVRLDGIDNWLEIAVKSDNPGKVRFTFDGRSITKSIGDDGIAYAKTRVK